MSLYINPLHVSIDVDAEDFPQLCVCIEDMSITDPFLSSCGRFDAEPERDYGIPDDFARAMGVINGYMRSWHERKVERELADRRFVCAWSSEGYGDVGPALVDIRFFNFSDGYDEGDIARIKALEVGQVWSDHHHGPNSHIVYRVK